MKIILPCRRYILLFAAVLLFAGCHSNQSKPKQGSEVSLRYAKLFRIWEYDGYKIAEVRNPWDTTQLLKRYILAANPNSLTDSLKSVAITVPVQTLACVFSTHVCLANRLNVVNRITAVSELKYINNPTIRAQVAAGKTLEMGPSHSINMDILLKVNPQVLFVSPFKDNKYGAVEESGIPLAIDCSYMEEHPLARAEWLKFMALFVGKEAEANTIFDTIAHRYERLAAIGQSVAVKATVFSGKPFNEIWYMPGGQSYAARFMSDAGLSYLWSDVNVSGSQPLDFEVVYAKAANADLWLMHENYQGKFTYSKLVEENHRFSDFAAFKNHRIIFCNTYDNDYYEEGLLEPDVILSDILSLAHPELKLPHTPKYYRWMETE